MAATTMFEIRMTPFSARFDVRGTPLEAGPLRRMLLQAVGLYFVAADSVSTLVAGQDHRSWAAPRPR